MSADFVTLKPSRKADRYQAATALRNIARQFGFASYSQESGRDTLVRLAHPCGARASIWIAKESADGELVAWHTEPSSTWTFPDVFGDVNPCHHRKATKLYSWATLPAFLQSDCRKIATYAEGAA